MIVNTLDQIDRLRELLPVGSYVLPIVTSVARDGMSRQMRVVATVDGRPCDITVRVAHVLGMRRTKMDAMTVGGTGMDMRFHVVYELGHVLHGDGYALNLA